MPLRDEITYNDESAIYYVETKQSLTQLAKNTFRVTNEERRRHVLLEEPFPKYTFLSLLYFFFKMTPMTSCELYYNYLLILLLLRFISLY